MHSTLEIWLYIPIFYFTNYSQDYKEYFAFGNPGPFSRVLDPTREPLDTEPLFFHNFKRFWATQAHLNLQILSHPIPSSKKISSQKFPSRPNFVY